METKNIQVKFIAEAENLTETQLIQRLTEDGNSESISCVNWQEYSYKPEVSLHLAHSEKSLIVLFKVAEEHVLGSVLNNNGPVWEDSCVETFIQDPINEGYYNVEVNCIGTKLAAHRLSRTEFEHFNEEKLAEIRCYNSLEHKPISLENKEWTLLEIIPFNILGLDKAPEYLNANFYKCGDKCKTAHYLSWSPIELPNPDFHCPNFFGKLTF